MNDFNEANRYYANWRKAVKDSRELRGPFQVLACKFAIYMQTQYVCYLAQEWVGARK